MKHLETIFSCRLFSEIRKQDYILAFESLDITSRKYKKGNHIFFEGDEITTVCLPAYGRIREKNIIQMGMYTLLKL